MNQRRFTKGIDRKRVIELHRAWDHAAERAMNQRRFTKGIDRKRVIELHRAWDHAARIGCPLNVFITVRPLAKYGPRECCEFAARIRNKLGVYARQHGFTYEAVWSRECNPDDTGEHLHILMHVPRRYRHDLEQKLLHWYPGASEVDVRWATQVVNITQKGKRRSAVGYISKQMTPQAAFKSTFLRKAGGRILGKRAGVTRNLGHAAIEKYFNRHDSGPVPDRPKTDPMTRSKEEGRASTPHNAKPLDRYRKERFSKMLVADYLAGGRNLQSVSVQMLAQMWLELDSSLPQLRSEAKRQAKAGAKQELGRTLIKVNDLEIEFSLRGLTPRFDFGGPRLFSQIENLYRDARGSDELRVTRHAGKSEAQSQPDRAQFGCRNVLED